MFSRQAQVPESAEPDDAAFVAFGANLPDAERQPADTVLKAMELLEQAVDAPIVRSRLFRTPAFPPGAGPDFVNAAARLSWTGLPEALLAHLNGIEASLGRTRQRRWEARIVDLDLIALGSAIRPDAATQSYWVGISPEMAGRVAPQELILPHPRLSERAFVLVPLAEIASGWRHPVTGETVAAMLANCPQDEVDAITPLSGPEIPARALPTPAPGDT